MEFESPPGESPPSPYTASSPPTPLPTGAYGIWTADSNGKAIDYRSPPEVPDPSDERAVGVYFGPLPGVSPPQDQLELQDKLEEALETVRVMYIKDGVIDRRFRAPYTRLFRAAQLGLEGLALPDVARLALARISHDLIVAEGGRVKNAHLAKLGGYALSMIGVFTLLYVLARAPIFAFYLEHLAVDPDMASSFMMLWAGASGGVWLSYAIRKKTFTLRDLIVTDDDRLLPLTRLVFAGALTMVVGLLFAGGFIDVSVGGRQLSTFAEDPTLALLLGLVCGISELLLPTMVAKRVSDFVDKL